MNGWNYYNYYKKAPDRIKKDAAGRILGGI
jgi:hypothetical protein